MRSMVRYTESSNRGGGEGVSFWPTLYSRLNPPLQYSILPVKYIRRELCENLLLFVMFDRFSRTTIPGLVYTAAE